MLAKDWMAAEPQYKGLHGTFNKKLREEWLAGRFDRYALLAEGDYQNPEACRFHKELHGATGADIPRAIEKHIRDNHFAPASSSTRHRPKAPMAPVHLLS